MTDKLLKLLDLVAEALSLYIRKTTAELGEGLPIKDSVRIVGEIPNIPAPAKERKPRGPNKEKSSIAAEVPVTRAEIVPESPFGSLGGAQEPVEIVKASIEDQAEAKRRCQEVMGLFIRRYLRAQPTGLDRAKGILTKVCGRTIAKLEDLTHDDNVKLIPVFEAELEKAA